MSDRDFLIAVRGCRTIFPASRTGRSRSRTVFSVLSEWSEQICNFGA